MENSLKIKSVKGMKWSSLNTVYNAIVSPIFYVLLAMLLTPHEYAYIAVITLIYRITPFVMKFGIEEAFIQNNRVTNKQASSLFYFTIILSTLLCLVVFFLSSSIESYYDLKGLGFLINLLLVAVFFEGMESVFKASLKKYFYFKEWAIILMIRMSIRIILTIILILLGYGILSVVLGIVFATFLTSMMFIYVSYLKSNLKLEVYFNPKLIKNFLKFGYPIAGKKTFEVFSQRVDEIVIGAIISPEKLGIYFFGKNLIMQLRTAVVKSFAMTLLPLYSKIKSSNGILKHTYYTILKYTAVITFPVLIGISLTADLFILIFFGEKWNGSIKVIQVLSIALIIPIITANNATSLLYSLNKPLLVFKTEIITTTIYLITLVFAEDIKEVLVLLSIYLLSNAMLLQYFVNKRLESNFKSFARNLKIVTVPIIIMVICVLIVRKIFTFYSSDTTELVLIVITGILSFTLSMIVSARKDAIKLFQLIFK